MAQLGSRKYTLEYLNLNKPKDSVLTVLNFMDGFKKPTVNCDCICGVNKTVRLDHFLNGRTLSCGCIRDERTKKANTKYFPVIEDVYSSWLSMMRRCYKPEYIHYKYYGGKGVHVCKEWHDYQNFLNWSLLNGWKDGLEIDKDIKGNGLLYSPETCLWVTKKQNNDDKNERRKKNRLVTCSIVE